MSCRAILASIRECTSSKKLSRKRDEWKKKLGTRRNKEKQKKKVVSGAKEEGGLALVCVEKSEETQAGLCVWMYKGYPIEERRMSRVLFIFETFFVF